MASECTHYDKNYRGNVAYTCIVLALYADSWPGPSLSFILSNHARVSQWGKELALVLPPFHIKLRLTIIKYCSRINVKYSQGMCVCVWGGGGTWPQNSLVINVSDQHQVCFPSCLKKLVNLISIHTFPYTDPLIPPNDNDNHAFHGDLLSVCPRSYLQSQSDSLPHLSEHSRVSSR